MTPDAADNSSPETGAPKHATPADESRAADRTTVISNTDDNGPKHHTHEQRLHQTLGPYKLVSLLGTGGMALVYEAESPNGERVALKVMQETPFLPAVTLERFRREAEAAGILGGHPGVVSVLDTGRVGRDHYIAMELVPGGRTLESLMEPPRKPIPDLLAVAIEIAAALAHAHDRGIIHRDIKPGNILLAPDGHPLLADFGLARNEFDTGRNLTVSAITMGTPRYMSPEQIASAKHTTYLSDMYSFGVILYELLTGRLPYEFSDDMGVADILDTVNNARPEDPRNIRPDISRDLAAVMITLLEKSPQHRYEDMDAVAEDLRACRAGSRVSVRAPTPLERFDRTVRRHPIRAVAACLACASGIGLWQWHHRTLQEERRSHALPKARAISEAKELESVKRMITSGAEPKAAHERTFREAHKAVVTAGDLERAKTLLRPLADAPGGGDVARLARRELARLKLAEGDWAGARTMFNDVAQSYKLMRDAKRLEEGNPGLTDARLAFARFEQGVACELAGDAVTAYLCWEEARHEVGPDTPLGKLCTAAMGELTPRQTAEFAAETSGAFRALAFWFAARRSKQPETADVWTISAADTAQSSLPWLYYTLRGTHNKDSEARGTTTP